MPGKKRAKVVKQRGKRTHGYGSQKKHRGKGSRGGKGLAGTKGHRRTFLLKYDRGHIGSRGFTSKTRKKLKTISLRLLEKLAGSSKKIDLAALGYDKVLGTGEIKTKLEVHADYFSAGAKEKIEKAGGKVVGAVGGAQEVKEEVVEEIKEERGEEVQEEAPEAGESG